MPLRPLALAYGSAQGRHGQDGAARLANMYAEEVGEEGKNRYALYAIDGMSRFATLTGGGIRAMLAMSDDELYAVAGRVVSRVDSAGTGTVVGGMVSDGMVTMARNRRAVPQIMITCDGSTVKIEGGLLTTYTDADLPPANSVCMHSGYFVWTHYDGRMTFAGPDDDDTDALDFVTANASADALLRGYSRGSDLLLAGQRSIESWGDTGGDTPFVRSTVIQIGVLSPQSMCDIDTTVAFVAHDGTICVLNGYTPQRVSNHEVERLIADDTSPTTIRGYGWTERGHRFVGFTGSTWTKVYDLTTDKWHDRQSYGLTRWRCGSAVQLGTRRLFGHISSPHILLSDDSLHTEDGDVIQTVAQLPPVHAFPNDVRMDALYIDVVPGVGLGTGASQDVTPRLMVDYSDDGGSTFSAQRMLEMGAQGQRLTRVRTHRLGTIRQTGRTIRVAASASVVRCIQAVSADLSPLR